MTTSWSPLNCDNDMIKRSGMTLVELLVVLAILALLTTVAVTSTDVVLSQGRYDATKGTLTNIQEAVLGPPNARQADGTLVSIGFVADVGRWPVCTSTDLTGGSSADLGAAPGSCCSNRRGSRRLR